MGVEEYKRLIIEMVGKIEDRDFLIDVYSFILGMLQAK